MTTGPDHPATPTPPSCDATVQQVTDLIARLTGRDPTQCTPTTHLTELGIDSLDLLTLAVDLEHTFGVRVPDPMLIGFRRVADITSFAQTAGRP